MSECAAMRNLQLPIEVKGLGLAANGKTLLEGLDCTIETPGVTLIMGPNGAGKSLLIRCLHGLIATESGVIRYAGHPLSDQIRFAQAMVFQHPVLLRRTVEANLRFVTTLRNTAESVDTLLERVGLSHKAQQPARLLSGGEQQRLALARALACKPDVLFLDEPTASLDPASVLLIEQLVRTATETGTKVLLISHDLGQAKRLAEDVVFMHRGRIVEHASARTFFTAPESEAAKGYLSGDIVL